jgi:hypothetical protein
VLQDRYQARCSPRFTAALKLIVGGCLAAVIVAIMMVAVPSVGHIEARTRMVPMPVSLADHNSDAADSDIGVFRDDQWFVGDVQRTGKCRHRQERDEKKGKHSILHDILLGLGCSRSRCSAECALGVPVVCIELTSAVLETPLEERGSAALIRTAGSGRVARLIESRVRVQMM